MTYKQNTQEQVKVIRTSLKMTQEGMAATLGITRPTWSKMEKGTTDMNNAIHIALFAHATYAAEGNENLSALLKAIYKLDELNLHKFMDNLYK